MSTIKLPLQEGIDLQKAIHHMQTYKLSAATTKKIAINLNALNKAFPDGDAKRAEILEACGNPAETDPAFKQVVNETGKWLKETIIEVEFQQIRFGDLNIGDSDRSNHIPPVVVAHLLPMIDLS